MSQSDQKSDNVIDICNMLERRRQEEVWAFPGFTKDEIIAFDEVMDSFLDL